VLFRLTCYSFSDPAFLQSMVTQMGEKNDMTQRDDTPHQVAHELPEAQRMIATFRYFLRNVCGS
jgi:hypothetical protein